MTDHAAHTAVAPVQSATDNSEGMSYLESVPSKIVTLYIPLLIMIVILLFPFYWMALTSIKPDEQLDRRSPRLAVAPDGGHGAADRRHPGPCRRSGQ